MNSPVDELNCKECSALLHGDWLTTKDGEFCNHKCCFEWKNRTRAESPDSVDNCDCCGAEKQVLVYKHCRTCGSDYQDKDCLDLQNGESRSTPPVAGGEIERVIEGLKRLLKAVCDKDHSKWEKEAYLSIPPKQDDTDHILKDAIDLLAALQHQDGVVVSRECVDAALNDMKSIRAMCMRAEMYPSHKQLAELEQSLERKNGQ